MLTESVTGAPERELEWRVIPGFPDYAVREDGVIKRIVPNSRGMHNGRIMKTKPYDKYGHRQVQLTKHVGNQQWVTVHQVVALAFHGPAPSAKHEVAHWDGVAWSNHYTNLRWATRKENHADMYRHGTDRRGERNGRAKLTREQVYAIKREFVAGVTLTAIAKKYGIGISTAARIRKGESWKHVEDTAA